MERIACPPFLSRALRSNVGITQSLSACPGLWHDSSFLGFLTLCWCVRGYHVRRFDLNQDPFLTRTPTRILVRTKVLLRHTVNMRLRAVEGNRLDMKDQKDQ